MEILFTITTLIITTLICLFAKRRVFIELFSIVASLIVLYESILLALKVSTYGAITPFNIFLVDSLGAIILLLVSSLYFVTMIYSVQYIRQETRKNIIGFTRVRQYFVLLNLFLLAMFLAIVANSPIFAWISIEATTLSTAFLISFYNKPSAIEGAWKYLIINSIGLLLGFFGTLLYFTSVRALGESGLVNWQMLMANAMQLDPIIAKTAFVFVLVGFGTKVGLVPMHTWKPDAYSKAPNPVGALLSGALMPIAFSIILRFKAITDNVVGPQFSQVLLIYFGILSIVVASLIILNAKNYKRLLAYSSIENAGIVAFGFGLGGLGIFAAILHLVYHSLVKGILFFSSGNILLKFNSARINNIKGALKTIPITSALFIAGFLIVTGMPPFGIFLTKMQILSEGMRNYPVLSFVALFFMTFVFIGFLKHVTSMFFSDKSDDIEIGESSIWLLIPPIILIITLIILSFYIPPFILILLNDIVRHY